MFMSSISCKIGHFNIGPFFTNFKNWLKFDFSVFLFSVFIHQLLVADVPLA